MTIFLLVLPIHRAVGVGIVIRMVIKALWSGDTIWRQTGPSLIQVMACRMIGTKPSPEPMMTHCQLNKVL